MEVWDADAEDVPSAGLRVCSQSELIKAAESLFFKRLHSAFQRMPDDCKILFVFFSGRPNAYADYCSPLDPREFLHVLNVAAFLLP